MTQPWQWMSAMPTIGIRRVACAGIAGCCARAASGHRTAIRRFGEGYQLCTILSDARLMANAAAAAVREARGQMAQAGAKTY
jgi:hypothetical protein